MAQTKTKRMTADEFLVWHLTQEDKFELVDGVPVLKHARSATARGSPAGRMMAGGTKNHSLIASNIQGYLFGQLKGTLCRPHGSDLAVRTSISQVRYPEVTVDCTPPTRDALESLNPIAVFEVLSRTTRPNDLQVKVLEYLRHPNLRTIVIVEPEIADVVVHARDTGGQWQTERLRSLDDKVAIQDTEAWLTPAEIYDGVTLDDAPTVDLARPAP